MAPRNPDDGAVVSDPQAEPPPPVEAPPPLSRFVAIQAGEYWMGSDEGTSDQKPKHRVTLDAFEIESTEVTANEYAGCVAEGACKPARTGNLCTADAPGKALHPINCVTWSQAAAYCAWKKMRLPTEAEWEAAARGSEGRRFVWGDEWPPPGRVANLAGVDTRSLRPHWGVIAGYEDGHPGTCVVDALRTDVSPSGGIGFAGNVMEWVADYYDARAYGSAPRTNPTGPRRGDARVVRGASFGEYREAYVQVTHRAFYAQDVDSIHIGFRCAR